MVMRNLDKYLRYISKGIKNYFTISSALFISRILAGIILIITARILGSEKYAFFSAGFFAMSIIGLSTTGIDKTFVYQFVKNASDKQTDYFAGFLTLKIFIYLLIVLLLLMLVPLFKVFFGTLSQPLICGILISVSFLILSFVSTVYQAKQLFKIYSFVNLAFYLVVFLWFLGGAFLLHNSSVYYYLLAYIVGASFILPFVWGKDLVFSFNLKQAKRLFFLSKWLLLAELSWLFFIRLDYFTISKILSQEGLGNYALALSSVNVFFVFVSSMAVIILPKAAEIKSKAQLVHFWKLNFVISSFLFLINICTLVVAGRLILIVFGPQYAKSIIFFRWMLIAYLPTIFFPPFQYILLTFKKEVFYFLFYINLPLSYLIGFKPLTALMGANGAIMAKGVSFASSLLIGVLVYYKNRKLII